MEADVLPQRDEFIPVLDPSRLLSGAIIQVRNRIPFGAIPTAACIRSFNLENGRAIPDWPHSVTIIIELMRVIYPCIWVEYERGYYPGILCEIIKSRDGFYDNVIVALLEKELGRVIIGLRRDCKPSLYLKAPSIPHPISSFNCGARPVS